MTRQLGRKAIKTDSRTLMLRKYVDHQALPDLPVNIDWTQGQTDWGMMLNGAAPENPSYCRDGLGCCTIAAAAHGIQVWSKNAIKLELTPTNADVLAAYIDWDGYRVGDPSTDNGGIMLDVLNKWRKSNLGGHGLTAFAAVDPPLLYHVRLSIFLFGGMYVGLKVPAFMLDAEPGSILDDTVPGLDCRVVGGHAVFAAGVMLTPKGLRIAIISWGSIYWMTERFWLNYVDEAYALLSPNWINSDTGAPNGLKYEELMSDMQAIR